MRIEVNFSTLTIPKKMEKISFRKVVVAIYKFALPLFS
jgi:hypothetical protein